MFSDMKNNYAPTTTVSIRPLGIQWWKKFFEIPSSSWSQQSFFQNSFTQIKFKQTRDAAVMFLNLISESIKRYVSRPPPVEGWRWKWAGLITHIHSCWEKWERKKKKGEKGETKQTIWKWVISHIEYILLKNKSQKSLLNLSIYYSKILVENHSWI